MLVNKRKKQRILDQGSESICFMMIRKICFLKTIHCPVAHQLYSSKVKKRWFKTWNLLPPWSISWLYICIWGSVSSMYWKQGLVDRGVTRWLKLPFPKFSFSFWVGMGSFLIHCGKMHLAPWYSKWTAISCNLVIKIPGLQLRGIRIPECEAQHSAW